MTRRIQFEGTIHEFPDDFTDDEISKALTSLPKAVPEQQAENAPGRLERFGRGVMDFYKGLNQVRLNSNPQPALEPWDISERDRINYYDQGGPNNPQVKENARLYNQKLAREEAEFQERRGPNAGFDGYRFMGNLAGASPTMMIPGGQGFMGMVGSGAATGLANALGTPVTDTSKPFWDQKRGQVGTGMATGAIFNGLLNIATRGIAPKVSDDVKLLQKKGVTLTPGMASGFEKAEDKLTSIPIMGKGVVNQQRRATESLNLAAYNEALMPIGKKATGKVGFEGIEEVGDALSNAYDDVVPKLKLVPDSELMTELSDAAAMTATMSKKAAKQFEAIMTKGLPNGPLEGEAIKKVQSKIAKEIGRFSRSADPSDQMIAEALEKVRDAIAENTAKATPDVADQIRNINKGWAILTRLERAAAGTDDGVFTGKQLLAAVRSADDSVRKRGFARGGALLQDLAGAGSRVVGNRYPDSGTGGRVIPAIMAAGAGFGAATAPGAVLAGGGALGAGRLAYTDTGNDLLTAVLTKRFQNAPQFADAVRKGSVPATAALSSFLMGNQ